VLQVSHILTSNYQPNFESNKPPNSRCICSIERHRSSVNRDTPRGNVNKGGTMVGYILDAKH
jgi:hypothetical protein